jgi:redox-sensitive bicupin YhaK (pirin superfamily)
VQVTKSNKPVKQLRSIQRNSGSHWVGNGFPVRTLFSYSQFGAALSPFLLLDYAGPTTFPPTQERLGVGEHPHRGFETVTIVYDGEVEHRDSAGGGGKIGAGDVQWMTAASGLVHEEFHGSAFAQSGGAFEMVQLWVNLPAKDKMTKPRYQGITSAQIPVVKLPDNQGSVRVIAGEFAGKAGPAKTFTPIHVWDMRLNSQKSIEIDTPDGYTTILVVLKGAIKINDSGVIFTAEFGLMDPARESIVIHTIEDSVVLLLSGEPINEPIVGSGPFVMNTAEEIRQAISDYQNGKMGQLS